MNGITLRRARLVLGWNRECVRFLQEQIITRSLVLADDQWQQRIYIVARFFIRNLKHAVLL